MGEKKNTQKNTNMAENSKVTIATAAWERKHTRLQVVKKGVYWELELENYLSYYSYDYDKRRFYMYLEIKS